MIIGVLLFSAAVGIWCLRHPARGGERTAQIYVGDALVRAVDLNRAEDEIFSPAGQPNVTLEIRDGKICFLHSVCPDHICEQYGRIGTPGQFAACVPNRVIIRITGDGQSDADATA